MPTENRVQYYVPRYSTLTYLSLALLLLQIHFSFFFATRIIVVACSISEKKLQSATTTTLEKSTKRYFMSFSTLRIRNIAKAEWTLPHLGNLVKGVTFVDHQARRLCICLMKKKKKLWLVQFIELGMYVSTISFVSKFLSNSSWPLQSYGFTFKANDAK